MMLGVGGSSQASIFFPATFDPNWVYHFIESKIPWHWAALAPQNVYENFYGVLMGLRGQIEKKTSNGLEQVSGRSIEIVKLKEIGNLTQTPPKKKKMKVEKKFLGYPKSVFLDEG